MVTASFCRISPAEIVASNFLLGKAPKSAVPTAENPTVSVTWTNDPVLTLTIGRSDITKSPGTKSFDTKSPKPPIGLGLTSTNDDWVASEHFSSSRRLSRHPSDLGRGSFSRSTNTVSSFPKRSLKGAYPCGLSSRSEVPRKSISGLSSCTLKGLEVRTERFSYRGRRFLTTRRRGAAIFSVGFTL
jgi:hypothetical protein